MTGHIPSHLLFDSNAHPGERFKTPWIGDQPEIYKRREYMEDYFKWMSPNEMHRYPKLREHAEKVIALALKRAQWKEVSGKYFAYMVDMITWKCFFERSRPNDPEWPWKIIPPTYGAGEAMSKRYNDLRRKDDSDLEPPTPVPEPIPQPVPEVVVSEPLEPRSALILRKQTFLEIYKRIMDIKSEYGIISEETAEVFNKLEKYLDKKDYQCGLDYTREGFKTPPLGPVPMSDLELHQYKDTIEREEYRRQQLKLLSPPKESRHPTLAKKLLRNRSASTGNMLRDRSTSTGAEESLFVEEKAADAIPKQVPVKRARPNTPEPEPSKIVHEENNPMAGFMKSLYTMSKHLRLDLDGKVDLVTLMRSLVSDGQSKRLHNFVNYDTSEAWICFKTLLETDLTGCSTEELERVGCVKHDGNCGHFLRVVSKGPLSREMQFKTLRDGAN
ncbi:hypothetical protein ACHAPT_012559 [Fusarium lateritium]